MSDTVKVNSRTYLNKDEFNRQLDIRNRNTALMLDSTSQRVKNDNLWNEKGRLSPEQQKYHINDHTFRSSPVNISYVKSIERQEAIQKKVNSNFTSRHDSLKR